jgi:hypothetical protein
MTAAAGPPARAWWLRTLYRWHWISSAIALLGMLAFAATGITLNHAAQIEARPEIVDRKATLPPALLSAHAPRAGEKKHDAPIGTDLGDWVAGALRVDVHGRSAEWSPEEIYVALPRPGGDAWVRIDRESGEAEHEDTSRGWISYFNDLHKGRNAGQAWSVFIDAFAIACLVFTITGLVILKMHAGNRPGTWPLVGLGVVLALLLAILFIH